MSFTSAIVTAVLVFLCANVQTLCTGQAAQPAPYHKHICPYLAPPLDHTTTAFPDTKPSRQRAHPPPRQAIGKSLAQYKIHWEGAFPAYWFGPIFSFWLRSSIFDSSGSAYTSR